MYTVYTIMNIFPPHPNTLTHTHTHTHTRAPKASRTRAHTHPIVVKCKSYAYVIGLLKNMLTCLLTQTHTHTHISGNFARLSVDLIQLNFHVHAAVSFLTFCPNELSTSILNIIMQVSSSPMLNKATIVLIASI